MSGVNNLNQFIQAEKITKDINPIYGSIQKLHARDTDLVTLCEDKILKILANKDAVYEADGNSQLTATNRVLGQTTPFVGEFGISKNPESFASESYRVYFTDKQRGAVMRLSKDGLTPISNHGMKDWFRDNLKLSSKLIGSYDDRNDDYNITMVNDNLEWSGTNKLPVTISFSEDVRGWVSFKSFVPENGISCANNYFTILQGRLYKHDIEGEDRNTFYKDILTKNSFGESSITTVLNDSPGSIKSFHTLDYEGSQSKINLFAIDDNTRIDDAQPYNLEEKPGWYAHDITTDKQRGSINEFIEKEGKWFNYIKGIDNFEINFITDFGAFNIQGIGFVEDVDTGDNTLTFNENITINTSLQVGDFIYFLSTNQEGGYDIASGNNIIKHGDVLGIDVEDNTIEINKWGPPFTDPTPGSYILFSKNQIANVSSLLGYYADVTFKNNSTDKIELFSIGSEITESSK